MFSLVDWLLTVAIYAAWWQALVAMREREDAAQREVTGGVREEKVAALTFSSHPLLADSLEDLRKAGAFADIASFIDGAGRAYEAILTAYATGDIAPVDPLLAPAIRDAFAEAIERRRARNESVEFAFIGLDVTEPVAGGWVDADNVWVDVRFAAEIASVTRNATGQVIAGYANRIVRTSETWTFQRPIGTMDPNWVLAATREGE